jgi:peptidoglycan/LPS O-acetylase OafA/YrhL
MRYALLEPFRGLAAFWVFCFHYHFSDAFQRSFPALHALLKLGDLGVPMFFVVSGFCIAASARSAIRHDEPLTGFLHRRVRRIYPPYWLSILVVAALPFVIEAVSSLKTGQYTPPSDANLNYGFLNYNFSDWLLVGTLAQVFAHVPDAASLQYKFATINAVYWTLAIEVQFYVAATLALALRRWFYPVILLITVASVPFLFVPSVALTGIFLPFWPMFAVGMLVYWLFERGLTPSHLLRARAGAVSLLCAGGLAAGFVAYVLAGLPVRPLGFAVFFGLFLLVAEGADRLFIEKGLSAKRAYMRVPAALLAALGAMSYSLYLLHGRLQFFSMQPVRQVLRADSILFDITVIAVTCTLCYLFYLACERPFMPRKQRAADRAAPASERGSRAVVVTAAAAGSPAAL